jgi:hypothetical protein
MKETRQFFKLYVTAFPDLHFDIEQILPAGDSHVVGRCALRESTTVGTVLLGSGGDDQRRLGRVEDRGPWHCSWSHARYREVSEMAKLMESLRLLLARIRRLIVGGR